MSYGFARALRNGRGEYMVPGTRTTRTSETRQKVPGFELGLLELQRRGGFAVRSLVLSFFGLAVRIPFDDELRVPTSTQTTSS